MPIIEILHGRDPDSSCELTVFVDGVRVEEYALLDVDPGAGHERESWLERIESVRSDTDASKAFREAALRELEGALSSQYIID